MYNEGISYEADILNLGEKFGIIKKAGASYSYGPLKLGHGFEKAKTHLKENPKTTKELIKKIKEANKT